MGGSEEGPNVLALPYVAVTTVTAATAIATLIGLTVVSIDAVKRLRRELDKVLALQEQIDVIEKSIAEARQSIAETQPSRDTLQLLTELEATHGMLTKQADALYASLNIQDVFPALRDVPLDVARLLLTMRDLKINIRRRAVGSFFEWETLDRAVSGRREPLGTC